MKISGFKLYLFFFFGAFYFLLNCCFFYYNLESYTSQYSSDGVTWTHQIFYNFLHDRAFQTSLYASLGNGESVGYSFNPFPYLHIFAVHTIISPILFAYIWGIFPSIEWLYGLILLINYTSLIIFTFLTLRHFSPQTYKLKSVYAISFLLSSGFLYIFIANAQPLLLATPFILGAYYGLIRSRMTLYIFSIILLIFMSEDAALIGITFSIYIYFFDCKKKNYALISGLLSLFYLVIILLLIQPASRAELTLTHSTTMVLVIKKIFEFDFGKVYDSFFGLAPALFFLPSLLITYFYFGKSKIDNTKLLVLLFLPGAAHWGESIIVGAGHHLAPVIIFIYIGFILQLALTADIIPYRKNINFKNKLIISCLLLFYICASLRILASNLPPQLLIPALNFLKMTQVTNALISKNLEGGSNKKIVEALSSISKKASISYWTNSSVEGFIAGRSDIWRFPEYYDEVDYLIMQPGGTHSAFGVEGGDELSLSDVLVNGKSSNNNTAKISVNVVNKIISDLVQQKKTHTILQQEYNLVILERINKKPFYIHDSTINYGWLNVYLKSN